MHALYPIRRAAWLLLVVVIGGSRAEGAAAPSNTQLAAASSDSILWLLVGEWDAHEKTFLNWLAYQDRTAAQVRPATSTRAQMGRVLRWAVAGDSLHVFYEGGTHYRYTTSGHRRELRLPNDAIPEALAGQREENVPRLWAVVRAETADAVATEHARRIKATQPASASAPAPESMPAVGERPLGAYALVQYTGTEWQPAFAAPAEAAFSERVWLCVAAGRWHLFWQKHRQDPQLFYAWSDGKGWTPGPSVPLSKPPTELYAGIINTEVVLAALVQDRADSPQLRCEIWRRPARPGASDRATWSSGGVLEDEKGSALHVPLGSAVSAFSGELVLLCMRDDQPQMGAWDLIKGGKPDQAFRAVPIRRRVEEPQAPRSMRELATMLLVALVMLLVLWRRQTSFALGLRLPADMILASPGKRAIAALIDMLPAAVFCLWWWYKPLTSFANEASGATLQQMQALLPEELLWGFVWFRVLYVAWSIAFELGMGRTPGKWLLGCEVISESVGPPNWLQTVVRNITKIVELEPYLLIWPFMLIIFVTRNRQRIGDLLARTVVVERLPGGMDVRDEG